MKQLYALLLCGSLSLCVFDLHAQTIAVKAGHVIKPATGEVLDQQILLIKDGLITNIQEASEPFTADTLIDLSDSWLSPGLMDCHVHLTSNMSYRHFDYLQRYAEESNAFRALRGVHNAKLLLHGGFTAVKEIGNDGDYATADLVKAIRKGWVEGPHIQYAGKIIAPFGGQSSNVAPLSGAHWQREYLDADTQDEIRKAIRKNIYYGANTIKLVNGDQRYFYSEEDISVAVQEAQMAGIKVAVHAGGGAPAKNAILGGAASIEHGFFLDKDLLQLMKEKGTVLVGTDFYKTNLLAYGADSLQMNTLYNTIRDRLKLAYELGVEMAFGTDVIIDIDGKNRLENNLEILKTWKEAEIPPMHILKCMTTNAAALLGVTEQYGAIKENLMADLVAFKDSPLEDIENIKSVHFVMKGGNIVRND